MSAEPQRDPTPNRTSAANDDAARFRAILAHASPNALRLALYAATRDPELETMEVVRVPFWGGAFMVSALGDADAETVRDKALRFLLAGGADGQATPLADGADLRRMMEIFNAAPVSDFHYEIGRGDLIEDEFPLGVAWTKEPPEAVKQAFRVLVIGAGAAGIAAGVQLRRLGIPFTIVDRNPGVGGTWWTNDYPEARVDIASHHYQFSFMRNYPWRHYFATQPELKAYMEETVARYGLAGDIRLATEVASAQWDDARALWSVKLKSSDGAVEQIDVNAIISAAGVFNAINMPDIPGLADFQGRMFHTTAWDHDYDMTGKAAALIGVGSTGAQLMPAVARQAAHLSVFQRSPQWVSEIPGYRDPISDEQQWLFDHFPGYWAWFSYQSFSINMGGDPEGVQNFDADWQAKGGSVSERNDGMRESNMRYMREKIGHRPELMAKLTPTFPPMAKRPVVDNGWFDTLNRDNVELVTDPIERITADGIVTADGTERRFDLIVLGAGFKTERYLWPVEYVGRDGVTLEQAWEQDGARAYLGETVPGFPNLFIIYGPNGQGRAGGIIKWLEIWAAYALKGIIGLIENGQRSMEVRREIHDAYNRDMDAALEKCVWGAPGSKSYMINAQGRQNLNMPWKPTEYYRWIRDPNPDDFLYR